MKMSYELDIVTLLEGIVRSVLLACIELKLCQEVDDYNNEQKRIAFSDKKQIYC